MVTAMKNTYFYSRLYRLAAAVCAAALCTMEASVLGIQTTTDSNGWFHHTLAPTDARWYVGGSSNELSIWLPCGPLVFVEDTAGWQWHTNDAHAIVWHYADTQPLVIAGSGVVFAYTSVWREALMYTGISRTSQFPAARIEGVLYHGTDVRSALHLGGEDDAWAGNIVCVEYVPVLGPVVPESAGGVLLLGSLLVSRPARGGRNAQ